MPRPELAAKSASPKTTTRVSGFGASGAAPGAAAAAAETAAAMVIGPCLSPLAALNDTLPLDNRLLRSDSAQLRGLVSTIPCAVWPLTPPDTGVAERAKGYAVMNLNRCVIACDG